MSQKTLSSALVLANLNTLLTGVIMRVAGNATSNRIEGENITPSVISGIVNAKLQSKLNGVAGESTNVS
jgi:hypothetical protein